MFKENEVMMKKMVFYILCVEVFCSVSHADLLLKMEAPTTDLVLGGPSITVTISAWADDTAATGLNGLNGWGLSALVDTTGVAEVVADSVVFLEPSPWSAGDTFAASINDPVTGGTGSVEDLQLLTDALPQDSTAGVGGYTPIAQFDIQAIGSINDSVNYTLGGITFEGLLKDFTQLPGQFVPGESQTTFTIVPEPATLLMLGLGTMLAYRRKK
jgi:hypothetical protein